MESAFAWLSQLIETFYKFVPHILSSAQHTAV